MDPFIEHLVSEISDAFDGGLGRLVLLHDDVGQRVRFGYTRGEVRRLLTQVRRVVPHAAVMGFVGGVDPSLKETLVECCDGPEWVDYDEVFVEIAQALNAFGRIKFPALRDEDFRRGHLVISCPPTQAQLDFVCQTIEYEKFPYVEYRGTAAIEEQGDPTGRIKDHPPSSVTVAGQIYRRCLKGPNSVEDFMALGKKATVYSMTKNLCDRGWLERDDTVYTAVTFHERKQRLATVLAIR